MCMKLYSGNVFQCSDEDKKNVTEKVLSTNNFLKIKIKKMKKKVAERRRKKKKKTKKRKKKTKKGKKKAKKRKEKRIVLLTRLK